jgi:hypothetical protein
MVGWFNVVTDVILLAFPMYFVWRLQLSKKKKWGITIVFLVGLM